MIKKRLIIFSLALFMISNNSVNAATPLTCVYQKKENAKVVWTFTRDSSGNVSFISGGGKTAKDTSYLNSDIKNSCPKNIYYAYNGTCSTRKDRFIVDKPDTVVGADDTCDWYTYELISTENKTQSGNNDNSTSSSNIQTDGSLRCVYHNDSVKWTFTRDSSGKVTFKSNSGKVASKKEISNLIKNIINNCPSSIYYAKEDCTAPKNTYVMDMPNSIVGSEENCSFLTYSLLPAEYVDDTVDDTVDDEANLYCGIFGDKTWQYVKDIYAFIKIIIPALIVLLGMTDFLKVLFSGEEKDTKEAAQRFLKRIIAGIIFILLPVLLEFLISLVGFSENCLGQLK